MLTEWEKSHKLEILEAWDTLVLYRQRDHNFDSNEWYHVGWASGVLGAFDFDTPNSVAYED